MVAGCVTIRTTADESILGERSVCGRSRENIRRRPRPREASSGLDVKGAYLSTSMSGIGWGVVPKKFVQIIFLQKYEN
jgi:hypothetical protein